MGLKAIKIEHLEHDYQYNKDEKPWQDHSRSRKYLKKQKNRKMRRFNKEEKPQQNKYDGYEF